MSFPSFPTVPKVGSRGRSIATVLTGPGGSTFVSDTMTGDTADVVGGHTGEVGAVWAAHPSYANHLQIASGELFGVAASPAGAMVSGTATTADYDVSGDYVFVTDNNSNGVALMGRLDAAADTYYGLYLLTNGDAVSLVRVIAGAATTIASVAVTLANTSLTLRMRGSYIQGLINGVPRLGPIFDTSITAAGRVGVRSTGSAGAALGVHITNLTAVNAT